MSYPEQKPGGDQAAYAAAGQPYYPPQSYPPPPAPAPPVGYPTGYLPQDQPPQAPTETKDRGDGFWKGCCAALCCCCLLDACF